jgi:hypothetical protein
LFPCAVLSSSSKRPFVISPNSQDCYPPTHKKKEREKNFLEKKVKKKKKEKEKDRKNEKYMKN